jgi:DNA-binding response OmpR family regulator
VKKIILIDDDLDEAELFNDALRFIAQDYNFTSFSDGLEALRQISTQEPLPNFIFLDLNMPMLSGKDVLKRLRATRQGENIPVIIYSTSITESDINETEQFKVLEYLQKPETFEVLCAKLSGIIK